MAITKLSIAFLLYRYVQWLLCAAACQLFNLQLCHYVLLPLYCHHKPHPGSLRCWALSQDIKWTSIGTSLFLHKMYFVLPFWGVF